MDSQSVQSDPSGQASPPPSGDPMGHQSSQITPSGSLMEDQTIRQTAIMSQQEDAQSSSFPGSPRSSEHFTTSAQQINAADSTGSPQQPENALGNASSQPHSPDLTQANPEVSDKSAIPPVILPVGKFDILGDNPGYQDWVKRTTASGFMKAIGASPDVDVRKCKADMLPMVLHGKEKNAAMLYPDYLPDDTYKQFHMKPIFAYRGSDRPSFNTGKFTCSARHSALIQFHEADAVPGMKSYYGTPHINMQTPFMEKCLEVSIKPDTQIPSVVFIVKRHDRSNIRMQLNANNISASDRKIGISFHWGTDQHVQEVLPEDSHLRELANQGEILRVDISRKPGDEGKAAWSSDVTNATELIDTLTDHADAQMKGDLGDRMPLDNQDMLLALLDTSRELSVYVLTPGITMAVEHMRPLQDFAVFMKSCFWAAARRGNFWWYTLHSTLPPSTTDYRFNDGENLVARPRWLIEFFDVSYDVNGKPIACKPCRGGAGRHGERSDGGGSGNRRGNH